MSLDSQAGEADIRVPHFSVPLAAITLGGQARVKAVRIIKCIVLVAGVYLLWGCASTRVGLQGDGTYILERDEQSANCQALYKSIWGHIEILKGIPAKARGEQQTAPPTAASLFGRLFSGPNRGLAAVEEYDRERAHAYALQRAMNEKKCVAIDVDRELWDVTAEMATIRKN